MHGCDINPTAGGPDRWRVVDIAAGGRHSMVLAVPDNGNLKKAQSIAGSPGAVATRWNGRGGLDERVDTGALMNVLHKSLRCCFVHARVYQCVCPLLVLKEVGCAVFLVPGSIAMLQPVPPSY